MNRSTLKLIADNYYDCLRDQQTIKQKKQIAIKTIVAKKEIDNLLDSGIPLLKSYDGQYQMPFLSANNKNDCIELKAVFDKLAGYKGFNYQFTGQPDKCEIEMSWK